MAEAARRFVLIGHPVAHSLSPALHAAAYAALGLPHRYELVDTPDEPALGQVLGELRSGALAGANVTVPWKQRALALADEADALATEAGAANVLIPVAGRRLVAANTDVLALETELGGALSGAPEDVSADGPRRDGPLGDEPEAREGVAPCAGGAVILGGGGAALAAAVACRRLGLSPLTVTARAWASGVGEGPSVAAFRRLGAELVAWPGRDPAPLAARLSEARLLIQATSAGMHGADSGEALAALVPWANLPRELLAYDVVYTPAVTPFLRCARDAGLCARGGLGMLVEQARHALRLWLGVLPPAGPMRAAAERALSRAAGPAVQEPA